MHYSEYFRAAYNSNLEEAQNDLFTFGDVDAATFRAFVLWLYNGRISLDGRTCLAAEQDAEDDEAMSEDEEYAFPETESEIDLEEEDEDDCGDSISDSEEILPEEECLYAHGFRVKEASGLSVQHLAYLIETVENSPNSSNKPDHDKDHLPKWRQLLEDKLQYSNASVADTSDEAAVMSALIDLYLLADRLAVQQLKLDTISALHAQHRRGDALPSPVDVARAFENLPSSSPLRTWLVHAYAFGWDASEDSEANRTVLEQLPSNFIMDVLIVNTTRIRYGGTYFNAMPRDSCLYHQHETWAQVVACREKRGVVARGGMLSEEDFIETEEAQETHAEAEVPS